MKKKESKKIRSIILYGHCRICRTVKLSFLFLFLLQINLNANVLSQNMKISMSVKEISIKQFLDIVTQKTDINFIFSSSLIENMDKVSIHVEDEQVDKILKNTLESRGLTYEYEDGVVVIKKLPIVNQQIKVLHVKGRVYDVKKEPLPGVTVMIKGTNYGTVTNNIGVFNMQLPEMELPIQLAFSFIGMESTEFKYTGQDSIIITLVESAETLNEVVVTGFGTLDKRLSTSEIVSLKMDDIMMPGISTLDKMLESRVPGMVFMQNSGQVGATPRLRIRGTSTILGNQEPLWVVDDIIMDDPVDIDINRMNDLDFTNLLGNAISGLNPADIERIDILKDASATALYGARAGNGVIVVTTKKGNVGPPRVNYNFNSTITGRPHYSDKGIHVMNSQERVELSRELIEYGVKFSNNTSSDPFGYEQAYLEHFKYGSIDVEEFNRLSSFYQTINTDWFKILMRNSFSHSHTIGLSGGSQSSRFNISLGYTDEQGAIKKEFGKRYTALVNVTSQFKGTTLTFKADGSRYDREYTPNDVAVNSYAYNTSRAVPFKTIDGDLFQYTLGQIPYNIFTEIENSEYKVKQIRFGFNFNLKQKIFDFLTASFTAAYNFSFSEDIQWYGEFSHYIRSMNKYSDASKECPFGGELKTNINKNENYNLRAQLDFNKFLDTENKHFIFSSLGGEIRSSEYNKTALVERGYLRSRGSTFVDLGSFEDFSKYTEFLNWREKEGKTKYSKNLTNNISSYISLSYSFKNIYVFNLNGRVDFSNAFGDRSREKLNPIWSVSGKWDIKQDLFQYVNFINQLNMRVSYGLQGNMRNDQPTKLIFTKGQYDATIGKNVSTVKYFPNPDLKWEKTHSFNASLDFSFFKNGINGTVSYFYKKTIDAFYDKPVSDINGVSTYVINKGNIENKGFEFSFNINPINQKFDANGKRGFYWRFDPQISQTLNKLLKSGLKKEQHVLKEEYTLKEYLTGNAVVPGIPLNTIFSYKFKSLDSNGRPVFFDLEEDRREELIEKYNNMEHNERVLCFLEESGRRVPILQGGLYNVLGYRNFQLSFNLSYSFGNKVRLLKLVSGQFSGISPQKTQNVRKEFTQRWRVPGDELFKIIPGVQKDDNPSTIMFWFDYDSSNNIRWTRGQGMYEAYDNSNIRIVSGSYLRLQSLNFSYQLDQMFLKKLGLTSGFLSLSGSNLFTIAHKALKGQRPEQSGTASIINLSIRPTYTISLNVSF